jgi:hypothetical protein
VRTGRTIGLLAGTAALLAGAGGAAAHHSGAMYDRSKTVTVSGTVKDFLYVQPHSWIDLTTLGPDGKEVQWSFEGGTPGQMKMVGIAPSTLQAGDKVKITGYPLRDGRSGGAFLEITLPNGKVINTGRKPQSP